jgi:hypothetical protein
MDPIMQYQVVRVLHDERVREITRAQLHREPARPLRPLRNWAGRRLIALGNALGGEVPSRRIAVES